MHIAILGLSITSSWGNGHATTYRALVRQLSARGHRVTFLDRDLPWYSANRYTPAPAGARMESSAMKPSLILNLEDALIATAAATLLVGVPVVLVLLGLS